MTKRMKVFQVRGKTGRMEEREEERKEEIQRKKERKKEIGFSGLFEISLFYVKHYVWMPVSVIKCLD